MKRWLVLPLVFASILLSDSLSASCTSKLGELVDIDRCGVVNVSALTIEFTGVTTPYPVKTLHCRNYEITSGSETTSIRTCNTGELGDTKLFTIGGRRFKIEFDPEAPARRGSRITEER